MCYRKWVSHFPSVSNPPNTIEMVISNSVMFFQLCSTLQSLTGKYKGIQGNPCNENRDPVMRTGVPCNENRVFPVGIDLQGVPCKPYRVWVCSVSAVRDHKS